MNRCYPAFILARWPSLAKSVLVVSLLVLLGLAQTAQVAQAQDLRPSGGQLPEPQRIPPIPSTAQYGVLRVLNPPEVLLNGQAARLAPGARIRGTNNLILLSASLMGQDLNVRYTLEPMGLVQQVWILTAREISAYTPPKPPLPPH